MGVTYFKLNCVWVPCVLCAVTQLRVEMAKLRSEAQGVYKSLEELSDLLNELSSIPREVDESQQQQGT